MTNVDPPAPDSAEASAETDSDNAGEDSNDSNVAPPAYPAYSTPPPEGLRNLEDG